MILSIINVKKTKRKIRAALRQLRHMRRAERKLNNLGVFIDNISFSGCPIVFNY
jgi:hypothetical protein